MSQRRKSREFESEGKRPDWLDEALFSVPAREGVPGFRKRLHERLLAVAAEQKAAPAQQGWWEKIALFLAPLFTPRRTMQYAMVGAGMLLVTFLVVRGLGPTESNWVKVGEEVMVSVVVEPEAELEKVLFHLDLPEGVRLAAGSSEEIAGGNDLLFFQNLSQDKAVEIPLHLVATQPGNWLIKLRAEKGDFKWEETVPVQIVERG